MEKTEYKSDWEVGKLYRQAYEITKKYKVLWLFAIVAGSAGFSFNFSNSFNNTSFQQFFKSDKKESMMQSMQALGDSTSKAFEMFTHLFSVIPSWMYVLFGIEILFLIIYLAVFWTIYRAWAQAALLEGIQTSISGKAPSMRDSSEKAFRSIKSLMWLNIVPFLLYSLMMLIVFGIVFAIVAFASLGIKILAEILPIPTFLLAFTGYIILTMINVWAPRIVVIDHVAAREAFVRGYKIMKQKFIASLLLGIFNIVITGLIYAVPILIMITLVIVGIFTLKANTVLSVILFVIGGFAFFIFILFSSILSGIITTFKASVWSLAYQSIRGKYDK